jgi:hypothetical protein
MKDFYSDNMFYKDLKAQIEGLDVSNGKKIDMLFCLADCVADAILEGIDKARGVYNER